MHRRCQRRPARFPDNHPGSLSNAPSRVTHTQDSDLRNSRMYICFGHTAITHIAATGASNAQNAHVDTALLHDWHSSSPKNGCEGCRQTGARDKLQLRRARILHFRYDGQCELLCKHVGHVHEHELQRPEFDINRIDTCSRGVLQRHRRNVYASSSGWKGHNS